MKVVIYVPLLSYSIWTLKIQGYFSHTATGHNQVTVETSAALQKEHEVNIRRRTSSGTWHCVDQK